jgi:glycosyltransferase involved in cell wall biosynthesis
MRILIVTQKVDQTDANLGFFHQWIKEFSKHCEKVTVICLEKGTYALPENVNVLSLGKEEKKSRLTYITRFYKYIFKERAQYDTVFVHMNPEYVVLGGIFWKLLKKKVGLWYTHKSVTLKLRIAEKFVSRIFSASQQSFRLQTPKLVITGHGIDTELFHPAPQPVQGKLILLSAGRITPSKNIDTLIDAALQLQGDTVDFALRIAGEPIGTDDKIYFDEIKLKIANYKLGEHIQFIGSLANSEMPEFYRQGHVFINLSDTGSIDKAVLEAMASGLHIVTSNEAFKTMLDAKYITSKDPIDIAQKIVTLAHEPVDAALRSQVTGDHNLTLLIVRIMSHY